MINYPLELTTKFDNCEDEPLHLIGRIQSFGILIVLDREDYTILQVGENSALFFNDEIESLLNSQFVNYFPQELSNKVTNWLLEGKAYTILHIFYNNKDWTLRLYVQEKVLLVEIEEHFEEDIFYLNQLLYASIEKIKKAPTIPLLNQAYTDSLLKIVGYDRVLLMEFKENWQGEVVSESLLTENSNSFKNHHFPPQDIPTQARRLLLKGKYRYIPNINGESKALEPYINTITQQPTSLTGSSLRNPSELHLEYLNNMGAMGAFSLSIIVDNKLWGIVACHSFIPKTISIYRREVAQTLTDFFNTQLKVERDELNAELFEIFNSAREALLNQMTVNYEVWDGLTKGEYTLLDINDCDGVAIVWQSQFYMEGITPSQERILDLIDWFKEAKTDQQLFYTDNLSYHYPQAEEYKKTASGALFLKFNQENNNCIVWFKQEVVRETKWAGNPNNPEKKLVDTPYLHPRKSFNRWVELSRGYSEEWNSAEIQTVKLLLKDVSTFILAANKKLREVNFRLQQTLEEQQQLIEELHTAEEELKQTHDFQQEIIDKFSYNSIEHTSEFKDKQSRMGNVVIDQNHTILSFNNAAQNFYNDTLTVGTKFTSNYTSDEERQYYIFHDRALTGNKSFREIKKTLNGHSKWIKEYYYPIYDSSQKVCAISCDMQDATQRKKAEDLVHNLALIARNTHNAVIITDSSQKILWVNPSFNTLTGYSTEEALGNTVNNLLVGEETDINIVKELDDKIAQFISCEAELINYHKSGKKYWTNVYIQPYIDAFGEKRFFSFHTDITNQKLATLAISESEEKFRLLSENASDLIATQDKNGIFTYISPSINKVLGYTAEELLGKSSYNLIHPDYRKLFNKLQYIDLVKEKLQPSIEYLYKHNNGDYIWVESSFQIIIKDGQETETIQSITRDISARKKAQIALEQSNEDLKKANQELDRFVYSASHDLRSPIASALGLIEVMLMEDNVGELHKYINLQQQSLNRLDSFIKDIVNYSRNNRLEIGKEKIDWVEIIEEIFSNYNFLPDTQDIETEYFLEENCKDFYCDSLRLKIVLSNIISNALNYKNPRTDVQSFVKVWLTINEDKATVIVQDNGIGIDQSYQSRIFEMFFRASNAKPGSGIGLYIVKETLEKLKGRISFSSTVNQGTTFTIEVPNLGS